MRIAIRKLERVGFQKLLRCPEGPRERTPRVVILYAVINCLDMQNGTTFSLASNHHLPASWEGFRIEFLHSYRLASLSQGVRYTPPSLIIEISLYFTLYKMSEGLAHNGIAPGKFLAGWVHIWGVGRGGWITTLGLGPALCAALYFLAIAWVLKPPILHTRAFTRIISIMQTQIETCFGLQSLALLACPGSLTGAKATKLLGDWSKGSSHGKDLKLRRR
ncbi:hypothetical protein B0H14DRAFT_2579343 [Mycena olivaceomarginata]|nr:hypothetical protein B0H14DRAFT_2579343 [Mycena olivaceomarginata]